MDDDEVRRRQRQGLSRLIQQDREGLPHPSVGGTRGYPVYVREIEITRAQAGLDPIVASQRSISRWMTERLIPYRMTGNKNQSKLVGSDSLLLVIFLIIHPKASLDEMATFIYNEGGGLYSRQDLSKRLKALKVTRKVGSTEAYQAFLPHNIWRCDMFWSRSPPLGIVTIPRRRHIDADEFGMEMNRCNDKRGYSLSCFRVRSPGHYERTQKLTVLFAIEPGCPRLPLNVIGSIHRPRRWIRVIRSGGTNAATFADFIEYICNDIETNPVPTLLSDIDSDRNFLWDNLRAHMTPIVAQTLAVRPPGSNTTFGYVPRPPYQPKYGPIEYKICDLIAAVGKKSTPDWTLADLERALREEAQGISRGNLSFDNTFDHCGYTEDGRY